MQTKVWFTLDDETAPRQEFVTFLADKFPCSEEIAMRIAESIVGLNLKGGDEEVYVYLFQDDDRSKRADIVLDVKVTWEPDYDTTVAEPECEEEEDE